MVMGEQGWQEKITIYSSLKESQCQAFKTKPLTFQILLQWLLTQAGISQMKENEERTNSNLFYSPFSEI